LKKTGADTYPVKKISPISTIVITVVGIIFAEIVATVLINSLGWLSSAWRILLDVLIMVVLIFPLLFLLIYKPLQANLSEQKQVESDLRELKNDLELRIQERTVDLSQANENLQKEINARHQIEDELRKINDELDLRVLQRTQDLDRANQELQTEIDERIRSEAQLRLQSAALESAANGIIITGRNGYILWANSSFFHMTGYSLEEVQGTNPRFLKSGLHDNKFYQELWQTICSGKIWQGEITNRRKDGSLYIEDQTITPLMDEKGEITYFIAIKQDITTRKQAETALVESEEKFRTLVNWTYDWEKWVDPQGNIVYSSPSCERISGYLPEKFISDSTLLFRIVHPDDRKSYEEHRQLVHDELAGVNELEYRIIAHDGTEHWLEHICRPLFSKENRYLGRRISTRDITERKQYEDKLERQNKELLDLTISESR